MPSSANTDLLLFAPSTAQPLAQRLAGALGVALAPVEEREFEGGDHKMRALTDVQGRDVYVLAQLCGDSVASSNDRLVRLLFFMGGLKDAGAARVTACVPYLAYARKDRRTKSHDPINSRYVAQLFEAMGTDRIVVLDIHNLAAFENAFRIPTVPLDTAHLFAQHCAHVDAQAQWVVASPDVGGVKRARHVRDVLAERLKQDVGSAFMDKHRSAGVISGDSFVGDVKGKAVLIVDDIIGSSATMQRAVAACRKAGATQVHLAATHPVFTEQAQQLFAAPRTVGAPDTVVVTDSIELASEFRPHVGRGLTVLEIAPLYAETIKRLHANRSVADLCGL